MKRDAWARSLKRQPYAAMAQERKILREQGSLATTPQPQERPEPHNLRRYLPRACASLRVWNPNEANTVCCFSHWYRKYGCIDIVIPCRMQASRSRARSTDITFDHSSTSRYVRLNLPWGTEQRTARPLRRVPAIDSARDHMSIPSAATL